MSNLYELKVESYGVCLNIELMSIEKNAFHCKQINEDLYNFFYFLFSKYSIFPHKIKLKKIKKINCL